MTEVADGADRSAWQRRVEGTWFGAPGVYEPDGTLVGTFRATRRIVFGEDGEPFMRVDTDLDATGPLRARLAADYVLLKVLDGGASRIYDGPDFYGFGHPHGTNLVGTDYCEPWGADNAVNVQLFADGVTQAYSTLLYQGPRLVAAVCGLYRVAYDFDVNPATQASVEEFLAGERAAARSTFVRDAHEDGAWVGTVEVAGADQQPCGTCAVEYRMRHLSPFRTECTITFDGDVSGQVRFLRTRHANEVTFEGPDRYGCGMAYGRYLFATQYQRAELLRVVSREVLCDPDHLAVSWREFAGDHPHRLLNGLLTWTPTP